MTISAFHQLALSFPGTAATPHFDRTAFKVVGRRIFATLHEGSETVNLKLSPVDQSIYSQITTQLIYPVNNKWGVQGWTTFELRQMDPQLMQEAVETAYRQALENPRKK